MARTPYPGPPKVRRLGRISELIRSEPWSNPCAPASERMRPEPLPTSSAPTALFDTILKWAGQREELLRVGKMKLSDFNKRELDLFMLVGRWIAQSAETEGASVAASTNKTSGDV